MAFFCSPAILPHPAQSRRAATKLCARFWGCLRFYVQRRWPQAGDVEQENMFNPTVGVQVLGFRVSL